MRIGIVGLGLIGGSLAVDLRGRGLTVLGVSRQEKTCQIALERGVVERASISLSLLATAEIVFICTPISAIAPTLKRLIPELSPETIVTDVGSVKAPIVQECSQLWHYFVGGHPMAGTAEQGIEAVQKDLFVGAPYIVTPISTTPDYAVKQVEEIARSLGSTVYSCTPETHDRAVGWISHLPVMVSAGLIRACLTEQDATVLELAQQLASSGFRDTSRVGGGNPELGVMMARYNRDALLRSLSSYRESLAELITYIEQEDWDKLERILQSTQQARSSFLRS
jgi:arogenate dehydrogenase (NADP+)